jgi:uncharacterized membrane protein
MKLSLKILVSIALAGFMKSLSGWTIEDIQYGYPYMTGS